MNRQTGSSRIFIRLLIAVVLIPALYLWAYGQYNGSLKITLTDWLVIGVRLLVFGVFVAVGFEEIVRLFRRPAKGLGLGVGRVWSVARTALLEAWAGRIWLLPILWAIASFILLSVVRPTFPEDQMPQDINMLLSGQELLLLVMLWVMACVSLPRDRERKIIITTASKPVSRLEIILGKIVGFSAAAGLVLLVMGLFSWLILMGENHRIKAEANQRYATAKNDYQVQQDALRRQVATAPAAMAGGEGLKLPPNESDRILAEEGMLFAYNSVTVPQKNMSIVGRADYSELPPIRFIKGGSQEKIVYTFTPRLEASQFVSIMPAGMRPYFFFQYPVTVFSQTPLNKVQIRVVATRGSTVPPPKPQEKELTLNDQGKAVWEPDDPAELFSAVDEKGNIISDAGVVTVEVSCITQGVYLQVFDGKSPDPVTGNIPPNALFNIGYVADRTMSNGFRAPDANPVTRGFERRDKQEISGPKSSDVQMVAGGKSGVPLEEAIFRFPGDELRNIPLDSNNNFQLALNLEVYKTDNADQPTTARVFVRSYDALGDAPFSADITVREKRVMMIDVPGKYLGSGGDMIVSLYCTSDGHSIQMSETSVRIELPQTPFIINLAKSECVIFFEAVLIIGIAVTCSVRLGWPVAMLLTCVCYIFGTFVEFLASLQTYGGLGALNYRTRGNDDTAFKILDNLASGLWSSLTVISSMVPNFTRFQPLEYISSFQNMPFSVLLWDGIWTAIFVLPFVGIAYLLFRKQEVG